jgi:HTH-type transcriptional regulator/antitoxin HigA
MTGDTLDRIANTSSYNGLVREFPPRLIANDGALRATYRVIDRLMRLDSPSKDQSEYLELLSTLVEQYESTHHPTPKPSLAGLLGHLIESKATSQAEVAAGARVSASTLSDVLAGRRSLSLRNIVRLSRYFGVTPNLFVEATQA